MELHVDEASEDICSFMPATYQAMLFSATLSEEVEKLKGHALWICMSNKLEESWKAPQLCQGTFDHSMEQKSAISGCRLHWIPRAPSKGSVSSSRPGSFEWGLSRQGQSRSLHFFCCKLQVSAPEQRKSKKK